MHISSTPPPILGVMEAVIDNIININSHTCSLIDIKCDITYAINTVTENINHGFSGDITSLEKVSNLLNHPSVTEDKIKIINIQSFINESCYMVVFDNNKLFTITFITGETRFATATTSGDDIIINLEDSFNKLYSQIYAPDNDVIEDAEPDDNSTYVLV
jgi:hypothetical protein